MPNMNDSPLPLSDPKRYYDGASQPKLDAAYAVVALHDVASVLAGTTGSLNRLAPGSSSYLFIVLQITFGRPEWAAALIVLAKAQEDAGFYHNAFELWAHLGDHYTFLTSDGAVYTDEMRYVKHALARTALEFVGTAGTPEERQQRLDTLRATGRNAVADCGLHLAAQEILVKVQDRNVFVPILQEPASIASAEPLFWAAHRKAGLRSRNTADYTITTV